MRAARALHQLRLFTVSLIIATTIIESPVSAVAISRKSRQILQEDTFTEEYSSPLERSDGERIDSMSDNNVADAVKHIATTTAAKVYEVKGDQTVEDKTELTTAFILLKTDDGYLKITGLPIYASSVKDTELISSKVVTDLPHSTNSLRDNDNSVNIEDLTMATDSESTSSDTHNTNISEDPTTVIDSEFTSSDTHNTKNIDDQTTAIDSELASSDTNNSKINENLTTVIDSELASSDNHITNISEDPTTAIDSEFTSSDTHNTTIRFSDVTTQEVPAEITIDATTLDKNTNSDISNSESETKTINPIEVTTSDTMDSTSQFDLTDQSNELNSPSWKKYTTIDRKRGDAQMNTSRTEQDVVQTTPTRISLEKLLTDTSISSLGQLGESLSSKVTYAFDLASTSPYVQETKSVPPEETTTSSTTTSQKPLHITSLRAGYLDFSAKPMAEEATTIIENYDIPDKFNESRGFSSMFEFEPENEPVSENKTKSNLASRSQLAEDVMREEMMKEEMISNEEENANRQKENEQLSVKPLDKTNLYSVGPNYKPMKKLDVQAAKPFIRDPDDLSWRNESISSLGIVFKAKPAAKNFTEVLKNKTETLFNNVNEKDSKNDLPDLRERLEKIAEVRKSKKKKVIDKFGDTIYTDYEESSHSAERSSANSSDIGLTEGTTTTKTTTSPTTKPFEIVPTISVEPEVTTQVNVKHVFETTPYLETPETKPPSKLKNDYYDIADDYDSDYMNLPKIELKKFTTRLITKMPMTTSTFATSPFQKPSAYYWPDRKPTLQYFPPRPNTPKINIQTFDENPLNKLNYYTVKDTTKNLIPVSVRYTTQPVPSQPNLSFGQKHRNTTPLNNFENDLTKTVYYTQPKVAAVGHGYVDDGRYNRPTYVIKHFKDLVEKASRTEDEKDRDYDAYTSTQRPGRETVADLVKINQKLNLGDDYEYDTGFRKDVINRFVDNFNQNSERFKVDFPILYNNSVVHRKQEDESEWATSSAFMKRLYEDMSGARAARKECDGCERNVELPPEYELHYYVPEQEEREEADTRSDLKYLWDPNSQR
ncbi:uncharacterized protein LOC128683425 isoform X2 [Plodia interpunctella]|uniref:uncharacterized protein LOC128683425 isoform X2 n=1 Tax=Plodia interpunctella TaxID=58824 RepID=UPI002367D16C|nr:uncharacterized protein LOC128683425 isoform X2 [Plodia interpunctella]